MWLVPLLTALWANLHPSAFLAPALASFVALARHDRRLGAAAVLSLLALGATPSGFAWLAGMMPRGDNLVLFRGIDEWQSPQFREPRTWFSLAYLVLALLARRAGERLGRAELLLGLGCVVGPLLAIRLAPVAALLWAPRLARDLAALGRGLGGAAGRAWREAQEALAPFERVFRPGPWPVALALLALALAPWLGRAFPAVATGFPADEFPHAALARASELRLGPRVFSGYGWGGFVSWESGARWKVFIDGRAGFFQGEPLRDYLAIAQLRPGWNAALERWRPDWLLVRPDAAVVAAAPLTGRWRVAWSDSTAAILVPVAGAGPAATAAATRTPANP
jgi:hypothetical protein